MTRWALAKDAPYYMGLHPWLHLTHLLGCLPYCTGVGRWCCWDGPCLGAQSFPKGGHTSRNQMLGQGSLLGALLTEDGRWSLRGVTRT
jgi:hypothetical protein